MQNQFSRSELLIGKEGIEKLHKSRVAIFGIGGVGGYTVDALVRSGVEQIDLIDDDKVCLTNLNRQLIATRKTVGKDKVDIMRERILEINPKVTVNVYKTFFLPENADTFPFEEYDYIPIISCMGAGNKMDASAFKVADIYKTKVCPLAKVMRRELKKRGVKKLKVVYSEEKPMTPIEDENDNCKNHCICPPGVQRTCLQRRSVPGSMAFVPAVAGLIIAGEVVKDIIAE